MQLCLYRKKTKSSTRNTQWQAWGTTTTGSWGFTMTLQQRRLDCSQSWGRTNLNSLVGSLFISSAVRKLQTAPNRTVLKHSSQSECSPGPCSSNWCKVSYLLFYWLLKQNTGEAERECVYELWDRLCFSQSLCSPGPVELPASTHRERYKSSWRRSSPTPMATCWSWPRSWSQGCREKQTRTNISWQIYVSLSFTCKYNILYNTMLIFEWQ